jgi:probable phosphoglycerate mutase
VRRFIVEADGGSRGNPGPAGYGAVVRDSETGEVLVEVAEHIGTATNNVAEYRGLIAGLRAAAELDPDARVDVRMDSKLVVEHMSGRWKIKHEGLRPLALEARGVFPSDRVTYTWIPRERNREADRLANEAMDDAQAGRAWTPRNDTPGPPLVVDEAEVEPAPPNRLGGWAPDLGVPMTMVLLRHGETAHSVEKRFSGRGGADPELTERGRQQAERAAAVLAARGSIVAVVASPLRRTVETGEFVAKALGLPVDLDDGFAECAFGDWDGLTFAEVHARWPAELETWLGSTAEAPPGGESFDQVARRVELARARLTARYPGQTVLVVTHVTPIKQLVRQALGAPAASIHRMELQPASLTVVQWFDGGAASLRLFNDTGHLRETAS